MNGRGARHVRSSQNHGSGRVRTVPRRARSRRSLRASRRVRTRSPFSAAGSSLRSSRAAENGSGRIRTRGRRAHSLRSFARLPGFEPAGTCDSLVTFVPRRIAWVRADSNHRPRPCKGRVIATRPRTPTVKNRAAELTLAFRDGTCFVEREPAGRPTSSGTGRGCALGERADASTAAGRALRGRATLCR